MERGAQGSVILISERGDRKEGTGPRKAQDLPCPFLSVLGTYRMLFSSNERDGETEST